MEKLEMLQAKRDEILDKINNHNHEVALLREELDSVQYRIGIQRLLSEKGDLPKDKKEDEIERLRKENKKLKNRIEAIEGELKVVRKQRAIEAAKILKRHMMSCPWTPNNLYMGTF